MAIRVWIVVLICIIPLFSSEKGAARFDYGTTSIFTSPFSSPSLLNEVPPTTFELSLTNFYSFSPRESTERMFDTHWGFIGGKGVHRWSGTFSYFEAFSLFREIEPTVRYAVSINQKFTMGAVAGLTILTVPDDRDVESLIEIGGSFTWERLSVGVDWNISNISTDSQRSIPEGVISLTAILKESRLGSQALKLYFNHTDRHAYLTLVENFAIVPWWNIAVSLRSSSFQFGIASVFNFGSTRTGVHFSRHADLGWNSTAAVQLIKK